MTTQTSVDNTINDLRYEIKFESCVKDKNNFFIQRSSAFFFLNKNIFYSWRHISWGLKNMDMPRQKPQMLHW